MTMVQKLAMKTTITALITSFRISKGLSPFLLHFRGFHKFITDFSFFHQNFKSFYCPIFSIFLSAYEL